MLGPQGSRVIQGRFQSLVPSFDPSSFASSVVRRGNAFQLPATCQWTSNLGSRGKPLSMAVQRKMEEVFQTDFSDVRIHEGPQVRQIGALAFTMGNDIYFQPGHYTPHSVHGQRLLGHELAHVVQQRAGRVRNPFRSGVAIVQDPGLEAEAERLSLASVKTHAAGAGSIVRKKRGADTASSDTVQPIGFLAGVGLAIGGSYLLDRGWEVAKNLWNRNSGYKVSLVVSHGITGGLRGASNVTSGGDEDTDLSSRVLKGSLGKFASMTGHAALRLDGPDGFVIYEMEATGVKKSTKETFGGTRETHHISKKQYEAIVSRCESDIAKKRSHKWLTLPLQDTINRWRGKEVSVFSCLGWALDVMASAGVSGGTFFDRYVLAFPLSAGQAGWHNTIFGKKMKLKPKTN